MEEVHEISDSRIYEGPVHAYWRSPDGRPYFVGAEEAVGRYLKEELRKSRKIGNSIPLVGQALVQLECDFFQWYFKIRGWRSPRTMGRKAEDRAKRNQYKLREIQDEVEYLRQKAREGDKDAISLLPCVQEHVQQYRRAIERQRRIGKLGSEFENLFYIEQNFDDFDDEYG